MKEKKLSSFTPEVPRRSTLDSIVNIEGRVRRKKLKQVLDCDLSAMVDRILVDVADILDHHSHILDFIFTEHGFNYGYVRDYIEGKCIKVRA